jgi:hypothetical protein
VVSDDQGRPVYTYASEPEDTAPEPSGTSYAAPQVAAAAAMWVETYRDALEGAFGSARWKIVEAFRLALKRSADSATASGTEGPGTSGEIRILDIERLLGTPPDAGPRLPQGRVGMDAGVW